MGRPKLNCNNGDKFGMFEVIDNTPIIKDGHTFVKVRCTNCGSEKMKALSDLKRRSSIGCKECFGSRKAIPINIGDTFGELTVSSGPIKGIRKNSVVYKCACSCGNITYASSYDLRAGKTTKCKSCSAKFSGIAIKLQNGMVGELSLDKFNKLKRSALSRKIKFSVSIDYLWNLFEAQHRNCAITGDKIESFNKASLDRIDSSKGYIPGNVQWVTIQANLSKHTMSMPELINFCNKVINHANQQPSASLTTCEGSETNGWNCITEYNTDTSADHVSDDIVRPIEKSIEL